MNESSPYILWLVSWYPNQMDKYDGDFIQRHAEAVSAFVPIHVLYFVRDKNNLVTDDFYIDEKQMGNLFETIIYYSVKNTSFKIADKFFSIRKYNSLYKRYIVDLFNKRGKPALVHVHVALKAGLIAQWIQRKYKIPFFLTEHWTAYLEEARPNIKSLNIFKRNLISKTIRNAVKVFTVSDYLGKAIQKRWPSINYQVVPNVVNTNIFFPGEDLSDSVLRLIHISGMHYQKDPESLFRAVGLLKRRGIRFSLEIFGVHENHVRTFLIKETIEAEVKIHPEVQQEVLAENLRKSHLLVLYSRYETFGCVIIEANACGIPVIVADTSQMREIVTNNVNGILIKLNSAEALAEGIIEFFNNRKQFNKDEIAASTEQYHYKKIGALLFKEYVTFINLPSTY